MCLALFCACTTAFAQKRGEPDIDVEQLRKLQFAQLAISNLYVDSVDQKKLVEDAINGMLSKLDPHSSYTNAEETRKLNEPLEGNFEGIGVQFNMLNDTLVVIQPTAKGPSERAGIVAGDRIVSVDGRPIAGVKMDRDSIMRLLRGPKNSKVVLGVVRRGVKAPLSFKVTRDKIPVNTVDAAYIIAPGIGYIHLERFGATSGKEVHDAIAKLQGEGMEKLIFDLGVNGGGYLGAAVDVASEFLPGGSLVVYTQGRTGKDSQLRASSNGLFRKGGLAILVDEYTASAAEIVSGAVQDHDRGIIVGRRTFGKGLVQRPVELPDGSMIRLTVSHYYTPSGRCIQKPYTMGDESFYAQDLVDRYQHGEYFSQDSIKHTGPAYHTHIGRVVYGGGGIIPDVFVPVDTTRATNFFIACNKKATQMRFSSAMFDKYKSRLSEIDNDAELGIFLDRMNIPSAFREYASSKDGITCTQKEWEETSEYLLPQLRALVGRYSKLGENAFYKMYLNIDPTLQKAIESDSHIRY